MDLVLLVGVFFGATILFPLVRQRARTGEWAVVALRAEEPVHRFVGVAFGGTLAVVGAVVVARAALGPAALGEWGAPDGVRAAGWGLAAGGLGVIALAQATMGRSWRIGVDERPTDLVTHGVYDRIRHPIYAGLGGLVAALVLLAPSPWTVMLLPLVACQLGLQTRLEEAHLARLHGDAYAAWAARTGRFLPALIRGAPTSGNRG